MQLHCHLPHLCTVSNQGSQVFGANGNMQASVLVLHTELRPREAQHVPYHPVESGLAWPDCLLWDMICIWGLGHHPPWCPGLEPAATGLLPT